MSSQKSGLSKTITFLSYEKVLVLCEKSLSEFSSNLYILRPPAWKKQFLWKGMMSSFTTHFWPMVLVSFIKNFFVKIRNYIFPTKYTRYDINIRKNSLFLKDLEISCDHFFTKLRFFVYKWKFFEKIKTICFQKTIRDSKNFPFS